MDWYLVHALTKIVFIQQVWIIQSLPLFLLYPAPRQESWEDSELFKPQPSSDVDALGKKRYVGKSKQNENRAK